MHAVSKPDPSGAEPSPAARAMIDRLMHHGEAIVIRGDSYRMKDKPTE